MEIAYSVRAGEICFLLKKKSHNTPKSLCGIWGGGSKKPRKPIALI